MMATMWRSFRELGPRPALVENECIFTMEIHHGGYFDSMPDGSKKYKIAKFNKLGGVCYLDGLDVDQLAWVEFNNIAWELGYREKPISYHYKLPGTLSCEGWVPIKNDADAIEMTKIIPKKKRQISIYITGGGKRKKKETEMDDECPMPLNWSNPLNHVDPRDKKIVVEATNVVSSQVYRSGDDSVENRRFNDVAEKSEGHKSNIKATRKEKGKAVLIGEQKEVAGATNKRKKTQGETHNTRNKEQTKYEDIDDSSSDDSDFYIDSDYEHTNSDDAEFEENITNPSAIEEYEEMGFEGVCSDDEENSDEFASWDGSEIDEDEAGNPLPKRSYKNPKTKSWIRAVDLGTPNFCVGQAFANSEELKEAVREYCIVFQRGLWFQKNNKKKIEVKCQLGCPFWLYASRIDKDDPTLYIKTLRQAHKCHVIQHSHHLNCNRVAKEIQEDLMVDTEWSRIGIQNRIQKKYKLDVSVQTIYRGKRAAQRMNEGHYLQQYNKLASYRKELLRSNPGSTVEIKTEMDGEVRRFHRMYVCLAACKEGWINGCRPIIGLDGCHIKGQHPGQILSAVGIDGNNGMFPVAYAVVEVENTETWKWFLKYLIWDLKMENPRSYTFITDKQKGLGIAISDLMPGAEHRHCVRHLYNNFKCKHPGEGLKQTIWNAARSSTLVWYNNNMDAMEKQSGDARKWFEDKPPEQWSRSHFRTISKCDILLNNLCESWNASILKHRDKPILTMLEEIRMDFMTRMANRRVACTRWTNMVGPRIAKIIEKIGKRTHEYRAYMSGEFLYQVIGGLYGNKHAVNLGMHTCTCRRWKLSGIPCVHAICAIFAKKLEPSLFVDNFLLPSTYLDAYNPIIYPIAGNDDWEPVDYPIAPPPYKKQAGRPKMKRTKEPGEGKAPPAPDATKMPRHLYGTKMTCGICKHKGHNKKGCPTIKIHSGEGSSKVGKASKNPQAKRATAPKGPRNVVRQTITSRSTWKKRKQAAGTNSSGTDQASSSQRGHEGTKITPCTSLHSTQQPTSQFMQQSQTSSEWACL